MMMKSRRERLTGECNNWHNRSPIFFLIPPSILSHFISGGVSVMTLKAELPGFLSVKNMEPEKHTEGTQRHTSARADSLCNPFNTVPFWTMYILNSSWKLGPHFCLFHTHTHTGCIVSLPLSPSLTSLVPHNASRSVFLSTGLHDVKYIFQIDHAYHSSFAAGHNPFAKWRPHQQPDDSQ